MSVSVQLSVEGALPLQRGPRWPPGTVWGQSPVLSSQLCLSWLFGFALGETNRI